MLACSLKQTDRTRSDASLGTVEELSGWASVAEALLGECACAALVDVAEPSARARLVVEYADSLVALVHMHAADVAALQLRAATAEEKRSDALARQLRAAVQECETMGSNLDSERTSRAALEEESRRLLNELLITQEEREALRAERTAVWCAVREAHAVAGVTCAAKATMEEHVRVLSEWVRSAQAALTSATALMGTTTPLPVTVTPYQPARLLYRRVLPTTPMNPVTASLLRVKEQVQQMREPSVAELQLAVGMYRHRGDEAAAPLTPSPRTRAATATATVLTPAPLPVNRSLGRSRSCTPHRSTNGSATQREVDVVASPPWRTRMMKLQEELKGLRRELGTATASP
ncbi:conserved hypothetical protein [Leishmania major strain Friedlin]|uniref:Uncharacterized protein n=1 Tax=Leishmania major TaxID=5664 RepID=Q9GRM8_LEIMA|nr:conserved hypothetical protein [Leishmania major strain Friedlin]CAC14468.1 conserved hypothetical protein [Leishmania major strain Friedlin]CAG9567663.1 hypothetical_protein_-_conserved [Leishmania major strain Friedlin]|eukprot:XP_888522.1 conserved hypothetical protein [Leishmania major strain Friedlin]